MAPALERLRQAKNLMFEAILDHTEHSRPAKAVYMESLSQKKKKAGNLSSHNSVSTPWLSRCFSKGKQMKVSSDAVHYY